MSKLETIVPDFKLCEQIPEGCHFYESALVWHTFNKGRADEYTIVMFRQDYDEDVPAPTLAEILAELPNHIHDASGDKWLVVFDTRNIDNQYQVGYAAIDARSKRVTSHGVYRARDENPATAALRLWLRAKGIEVKA